MKNLFNMFKIYLKAIILCPPYKWAFIIISIFTITATFALSLTTEVMHTNIGFGDINENPLNEEIIKNLQNLEGYTPIIYTSVEELKQDILLGKISGGFYLNPNKHPVITKDLSENIIAYFNIESSATPFVKETITSSYIKALAYNTAYLYMESKGIATKESMDFIKKDMAKTYSSDYLMEIEIVRPNQTVPTNQKNSYQIIIGSIMCSVLLILPSILAGWWKKYFNSGLVLKQKISLYLSFYVSFFIMCLSISPFALEAGFFKIFIANSLLAFLLFILFITLKNFKAWVAFSITIPLATVSFLFSQSVLSFATYNIPQVFSYLSPAWLYLQILNL